MKKNIFAFITVLTLSFSGISAQTLDEAGAAFNAGIQFAKDSSYAEAIVSIEKAIEICKKIGDDGMELQIKAEQLLPGTYFNLAKSLFEQKKYNDAIPNFEKSAQYADVMGETKTADASRTYLAGIYYAQGNAEYKNEALDKAIEKYNKALSYKPEYYKAFYGLGLVYKKQENLPLMKENLDKAIALAGDDEKTKGNAQDAAASAYQKAGALTLQAKKYTTSIENLIASQEYNSTEPRTYFYLAIAYNGLSKWDDAITAATKALELQTDDKSDIYFELAKAQENKGDKASACANYKNVTGGNNVAAAKFQIEQVLKCQ
ncbi:MAG TPA: tetratricopeptide repeat protein [Bacteroidales bacterium]|jgi:tetratricopeptide (TPR) repeat protein|nr:tetratricopeptide repeat protein [Bacteroidales bacterium]MDX9905936.1 tetratricopeptide repeat protein [Bacteroidales bacterium]HNQ83192.1 tetratricopeptide repeat protein [Bacteroidales bacterium]HOX79347.1 tetratricopeptide repeat protein [Bacteroidales bacterium]HPI86783.1 tetratricopeptide repeat protein [Bacteroidales bacterium]